MSTVAVIEAKGRRFAVDHRFGQLPEGIAWGKTHAVAVDAQDRVYVAHTARPENACQDTILIFDADGAFQGSWGSEYAGHAHGLLLIEQEGEAQLLLVDDDKGIFRCSLDGKVHQHIGKPAVYEAEGLKFGPANVARAPHGDLFLADGYGSHFVLHFNTAGELLNRFGGWGREPHHTRYAHGSFIAEVEGEALLHVAVDDPPAIKRFRLDGSFHSEMPGDWLHPRNIYPNHDGSIWAVPEMGGRLTLIDRVRDEVLHLGHWGKPMSEIFHLRHGPFDSFPAGTFGSPHGVGFLANGDIIVVEWLECGRVSKLSALE